MTHQPSNCYNLNMPGSMSSSLNIELLTVMPDYICIKLDRDVKTLNADARSRIMDAVVHWLNRSIERERTVKRRVYKRKSYRWLKQCFDKLCHRCSPAKLRDSLVGCLRTKGLPVSSPYFFGDKDDVRTPNNFD